MVAGDVRANENMALTAMHTLFAREHNRIVDACRARLSEEEKFQIARRVVGAEQQYITYNEFLPALGVRLSPVPWLRPDGQRRAQQRVRGRRLPGAQHDPRRIRAERDAGTTPRPQLEPSRRRASRSSAEDGRVELVSRSTWPSATRTCSTPSASARLAGPRRRAAVQERRADRQPVAQRAVPGPAARRSRPERLPRRPAVAGLLPGRADLGALDIQRGRDHGIPSLQRRCGGPSGCAPEARSRRSPARRATASRTTRSTDRPDQRPGHPRLRRARDADGNALDRRQPRRPSGRRRRHPPHARWPRA